MHLNKDPCQVEVVATERKYSAIVQQRANTGPA